MNDLRRGDLVWVHLEGVGSEQRGLRPAIITQNNMGNKVSPTLIIVPLTKFHQNKRLLPTQVKISRNLLGERYSDSIALTEQVRVIDKERVRRKTKISLPKDTLKELDKALITSLGVTV